MEHYRRAALVVGVDVLGSQANRHGKIDLHRTALPLPANGILERVFDFRAIKRALSRRNHIIAAGMIQAVDKRALGLVPDCVLADSLVRAGGDLVEDVREAKIRVNLLRSEEHTSELQSLMRNSC